MPSKSTVTVEESYIEITPKLALVITLWIGLTVGFVAGLVCAYFTLK